jgi:hypothetical protein
MANKQQLKDGGIIMFITSSRLTQRRIAAIGFRLFALVMCMGFVGLSSAFGQAEYSDSYIIDSDGSEQVYDAESGEYATAMPENVARPQLIGIGVSEAAYDSGTYSTETYTTISSPSETVSVSAYSGGYAYALSEAVSITLDPETSEDGDYTVNSQHTYYYERQDPCGPTNHRMERPMPPEPCYQVQTAPDTFRQSSPSFVRASYKPSLAGSLLPAWNTALYGYYVSYTFARFGVRRIYTGHQLISSNNCARNFRYAPFTYSKVCIADNLAGCPVGNIICAGYPSNYIEISRYKVSYYFASYCTPALLNRYSGTFPRCQY